MKNKEQVMYNPNTKEQLKKRLKCQDLCFQYNQLKPSQILEQETLLKQILHIEEAFHVEQPFYCNYGSNIYIGHHFSSKHNLQIMDNEKVIIGNYVFIDENCCIRCGSHPFDFNIRNTGYEFKAPVTIGNNVWIGANVTIHPGVCIGNNVVVLANTFVQQDLEQDGLYGGNPCVKLRDL
ncbi:MAG: sugar O-acetyltransferase [Erysipelotrichaceae bacterium]|nr:sugar O-acetyltransferase [Erysipelotrichaceae bacterium]